MGTPASFVSSKKLARTMSVPSVRQLRRVFGSITVGKLTSVEVVDRLMANRVVLRCAGIGRVHFDLEPGKSVLTCGCKRISIRIDRLSKVLHALHHINDLVRDVFGLCGG